MSRSGDRLLCKAHDTFNELCVAGRKLASPVVDVVLKSGPDMTAKCEADYVGPQLMAPNTEQAPREVVPLAVEVRDGGPGVIVT